MTLLTKPSRSYANVDYDSDGLSGVGTGTYADKEKVKSGKKLSKKGEGGFKTYRPPISETHLRKSLAYHDPNPTSHFAPLPSAFQSHRVKKEQALAGQRAEADHLLAPGYRSTHTPLTDDAESSAAGARRTAGGLAGFERRSKAESGGGLGGGRGLRPSASISSFSGPGTAGSGGGGSAGGAGRSAGVYLDSSGKLHDTEFDPFAGVSEMSRAKSRRRSAFGSDRRRGDDTSSSSGESEVGYAPSRRSGETGRVAATREEEEIRRRLEADRKRMDDVSGYAARRRSIMSEQHGAGGSGRGSPSIRSSDDGFTSAYSFSLAPSARTGTRSQQGYYPSPLSPSFQHPPSASSARVPTAEQPLAAGEATPPEKSTEMTDHLSPSPIPPTHPSRAMAPPPAKSKSKVEVKDGVKKIIGFDGPTTPLPTSALANLRVSGVRSPVLGSSSATADHFLPHPPYPAAPESARLSAAGTSRSSLDTTHPTGTAPARSPRPPTRRDRDDIYPETPAQTKRRQERDQRRAGGHAALAAARERGLAIDTTLAEGGRGRVLPEIEIVEDDDPRIIFPKEGGKSTRVQRKHDHVIRGPFAHALSAQSQIGMGTASGSGPGIGGSRSGSGQMNGYGSLGDLASLTAPPPSHPSHPGAGGGTSMRSFGGSKPSSLMDDAGGYLPSRWASGDKALRLTEDEREKYRPREWGGKHGDLGGREDEWHPGTKDALKRNLKDIATNARFSLYRTKKKLLRKAEM
ncbi:hypothetical protein IAT38_000966 [Cryptococcus sp. DSM 104549]